MNGRTPSGVRMDTADYTKSKQFGDLWRGELGILDRIRFHRAMRAWADDHASDEEIIYLVVAGVTGRRVVVLLTSHTIWLLKPFRRRYIRWLNERFICARAEGEIVLIFLQDPKDRAKETQFPMRIFTKSAA